LDVVPVSSEQARDLYEADLILIRPDQIVGWRGNSAEDARKILSSINFLGQQQAPRASPARLGPA
jgi:hypothetical protein